MNKRRKLSRAERIVVFDKTRGHCAYCGCELRFADMQVDHVIPINEWSKQGSDTLDNMLPACRSCNHYKSRSTLDGFRKNVENMPSVLMRDSVTYRNAVRFGLVTPTPHPVRFYFEDNPPECLGSGRIPTDEIIHCAECANAEAGMASDGFIYAGCKVWGGLVGPHDFCSRAVKREDT